MKIAVPLFKDRVSPHFGASSKLFLVEIRGETILQEVTWDVGGESPIEIARRLVDLGVDKLICGGIHSYDKEWLMRKGVEVLDNQTGVAKEVVQNFLRSKA